MLKQFIGGVRRNHALEHATVTLLLSRIPPTRMVARAGRNGFVLWGKVSREQLEANVREALVRLKGGEEHLAVTPLCGTNLAIGGLLTGAASMLAIGPRRSLDRLPAVATAAMFGLLAAQPIGRMAQRYFTTCADATDLEIIDVRQIGPRLYRVETRWSPPVNGTTPARAPAATDNAAV